MPENLTENSVGESFTPLGSNQYVAGSLLSLIDVEDGAPPNDKLYVFIEEMDEDTGKSIKIKVLL